MERLHHCLVATVLVVAGGCTDASKSERRDSATTSPDTGDRADATEPDADAVFDPDLCASAVTGTGLSAECAACLCTRDTCGDVIIDCTATQGCVELVDCAVKSDCALCPSPGDVDCLAPKCDLSGGLAVVVGTDLNSCTCQNCATICYGNVEQDAGVDVDADTEAP